MQLETLAPEIEQTLLKNLFKQGNDTYKVLPTQADREPFVLIMVGRPPSAENQIARAYRFFVKQLRNAPGLFLEKVKRVVVSNLIVVSIVLERDDNPHLIFESLNAKGLPLSQADLIRNYFFMRIHVDKQEQLYLQHWKPMQDRLGDGLTECIRHYLMKDGALVKQGEVYFALKERGDEKSPTEIVDYLSEVARFAGYYAKLVDPQQEPSQRLRERMFRLNRIEVTVAYPFLLNIYADFEANKLSEAEFTTVLDLLENFMIRRWVCGVPTYGLNKIFPPLYAQARQRAGFIDGLKEVLLTKNYPRDLDFMSRLVSAKLYAPGERAAKVSILLERLEESFDHQEPVSLADLTVEHIMPQTLTGWWQEHLGQDWDDQHQLLLHTLGNLTLTGYNTPLSNDDFPQKRQILDQSHLELNRYFECVAEWRESSIRERADALAARCLSVWPYFGAAHDGSLDGPVAVTGSTPVAVRLLGERLPVSSSRDVAQFTCESIARLDDERFGEIAAQFPRFFARDSSGFRTSRQLSNGVFMMTHLSASALNRLCVQVTQAAGFSADDWRVEYE